MQGEDFTLSARLMRLESSNSEEHFVPSSFPVTIGRDREADIRLDDRWVSRFHCEIDQIHGTLVVRDLHSRHGTHINGRRVEENLLMPGNRLGIGMSTFLVSYERTGRSTDRS
jgi:pSer/pThr/pTyr-binding forkhead associated (FHA) protein